MSKGLKGLICAVLLFATIAAAPAWADDGGTSLWQGFVQWIEAIFQGDHHAADSTAGSDDEYGPSMPIGG